MNAHTLIQGFAGAAGRIDTAIDRPRDPPRGLAVIAHPHPLYGGTRDNKVVQTLARAMVELGLLAVRPDFRGVGASQGAHDQGIGETDDLVSLTQQLLSHEWLAPARAASQRGIPMPLVLAGFSFGSFVQTRVAGALRERGIAVSRMVMVGTAVRRFEVQRVPEDSVIIHGDLDETVPLADLLEWARGGDAPVTVIPGADHFFHRRLTVIKRIVLRSLADLGATGPAIAPDDPSPND